MRNLTQLSKALAVAFILGVGLTFASQVSAFYYLNPFTKHLDFYNFSGSGLTNQVTFFTATNTLAGDTGMTYNSSTDALTVTNLFVTSCTGCGGGGGGGADGNWVYNATNGTIRPTTTTNDVLIGGTNTSTADFIFDVSASNKSVAVLPALAVTGTADGVGDYVGFPTKALQIIPDENYWNYIWQNQASVNGGDGYWGLFTGDGGNFSFAHILSDGSNYDLPLNIRPDINRVELGFELSQSVVSPGFDTGADLGQYSQRWRDEYLSRNIYASGTAFVGSGKISGGTTFGSFGGFATPFQVNTPDSITTWNTIMTNSNATNSYGFNVGNAGQFGIYSNEPSGQDAPFLFLPKSTWQEVGGASSGFPAPGVYLGGISTSHTVPYSTDSMNLGHAALSFHNFYASGTAFIGTDVKVNGVSVCLSSGTNCPAGTGTPTLQQVIAQGSTATSTPTFLGGIVVASSTATGTLNLPAQFATALLFTDSSRAVSSTSRITVNGNTGSVTSTNIFASVASSTNLFSNLAGIGTLTIGNFSANQGTSTLLSWTSASGSALKVAGQNVCLGNGVGCPTPAVSKPVLFNVTTSSGAFLAVNSVTNTSTCMTVPAVMNGWNLTAAIAQHGVAGSGGTSTQMQVRNETDGVDMLTVPLHIDPGERNSTDAATQMVINTATDDIATLDRICVDVDAVENTPGKETNVVLTFSLP